ncbi:hypothetical protein [Bacillus wiedmannii]|uniref:hypothetical protein n=1 Tax=Bacillus wiedmannii TaxID=1890302 RepID=UPI00216656A2|nr:hypothetical protein [Bacillus wiedmannii]
MPYIQDTMGNKFESGDIFSSYSDVPNKIQVRVKAKPKANQDNILTDTKVSNFSPSVIPYKGGVTMRVLKDVNKLGSIVLFILSILLFAGTMSNTGVSTVGGTILGTLSIVSSILFWIYSLKVERGC